MGNGVVTKAPHVISSLGLGSCVVVALYDTKRRVGGLAHIMLPESISLNGNRSSYQCADTAIPALLKGLRRRGSRKDDIVAKMVGGAQMFSSYQGTDKGIGAENIRKIKRILKEERIPLKGEDIGGHHGRSVEFHLDSGKFIVVAIGKEYREI